MKVYVAKNKHIEIKIVNARELLLLHNIDTVKTETTGKTIKSLDFYDYKVETNQHVEITVDNIKLNYKIKYIEKVSTYQYALYCDKITKSSIFLLPLVSPKNINNKSFFFNSYLYNAYYSFEGQDLYNDGKHLFLLYRFFNNDYFMDLDKFITGLPNFIKTFEPNKSFTCYILEYPLKLQSDANKLIKGKYSAISTTSKSKILTFHQAHVDSELSHILFKKQELKVRLEKELSCYIPEDIELCSKPDKKKEHIDENEL